MKTGCKHKSDMVKKSLAIVSLLGIKEDLGSKAIHLGSFPITYQVFIIGLGIFFSTRFVLTLQTHTLVFLSLAK